MIPLSYFLVLGMLLFCVGIGIIVTKRNVIVVLMGIELLFNAANINLVAFNRLYPDKLDGQLFALFVIVVAASEAVVALSIIIQLFKRFETIELNRLNSLGD
ncbi:NADH-quinone oxidoreductase subunit NuoK [Algivirga pacifica]|uniref:NADH-quinone oxidoreductase subunit K n=1 Tax=Algivirga pacifica TaxID=1162670 RepID=A0ABP9D5D6_9BACT